jgi:hypothetical protein
VKLSEWLDARTPKPPAALAARVRGALAPLLESEVEEGCGRTHTELLAAARSLLGAVLESEPAERACAHDLLAADALVTYAFEIAAEDAEAIDELAASTMRDFGALAAEGTT